MEKIQTILSLLGTESQSVEPSWQSYRGEVRKLLQGQDFLRLGHCIQGKQWHLVMSNSARLKVRCGELGITCFDNYLRGIRDAARRQDSAEALQIMGMITAKRVQLRNLLAEDE